MGEVLKQIWLKSMNVIKQISECTKREFEKISVVHAKLPQAHEKVCNENERIKKKRLATA